MSLRPGLYGGVHDIPRTRKKWLNLSYGRRGSLHSHPGFLSYNGAEIMPAARAQKRAGRRLCFTCRLISPPLPSPLMSLASPPSLFPPLPHPLLSLFYI